MRHKSRFSFLHKKFYLLNLVNRRQCFMDKYGETEILYMHKKSMKSLHTGGIALQSKGLGGCPSKLIESLDWAKDDNFTQLSALWKRAF